jgi:hypothetical protein
MELYSQYLHCTWIHHDKLHQNQIQESFFLAYNLEYEQYYQQYRENQLLRVIFMVVEDIISVIP